MAFEHNEFFKQLKAYDEGDWRKDAACRGMDTNMFFEEASTNEQRAEAAAKREVARKVCESCPVINECLKFATDNDIRYGMFGGLTYRSRLALRTGTKKPQSKKKVSQL
jgi:WhiB family transcriptional regulator, redox-sensing transcriptional regulator